MNLWIIWIDTLEGAFLGLVDREHAQWYRIVLDEYITEPLSMSIDFQVDPRGSLYHMTAISMVSRSGDLSCCTKFENLPNYPQIMSQKLIFLLSFLMIGF